MILMLKITIKAFVLIINKVLNWVDKKWDSEQDQKHIHVLYFTEQKIY
jgi:hypothetical protein